MTTPTNRDVVAVLTELAELSTLDEGSPNAFRVRAYRAAARAVDAHGGDIAALSADELADIRGIGRSIAARIRELVDHGRIARLEELRERYPAQQVALTRVPGLGPKKVARLADELDVRDVDSLVAALDDGRVAALDGFGPRGVDKLRAAIATLGLESKQRRVPFGDALPLAERLVEALRGDDSVHDAAVAGSLRRMRETVGDVDIVVAVDAPVDVLALVGATVAVDRVIGVGSTKTSFVTRDGLQVDVRQVAPAAFGAALVYFTGSAAHNIRLRQRAHERGATLSEYGLRPTDRPDDAATSGTTEDEVYAALDLPWIWPEIREDEGEIERAESGDLGATWFDTDDIHGDLHDHTDLSGDGRMTFNSLVDAAVERGWQYLAVTDHGEDLTMNGVSLAEMRDQRARLRAREDELGTIRLLHGAELNIGRDGGLDYDERARREFEWIVASVHSHFDLDVAAQTRRIIRAIEDPTVSVIGHLTTRMIGRRPPITFDVDAILAAATRTGTAIEINASLSRLDPPSDVLRQAAGAGVAFVISTDAHGRGELDRMRFGVAHARRAGLQPQHIMNTRPLDAFEDWRTRKRG